MSFFLVQHGRSLPKETDTEQGLSEEGISDVKRIAGVAKGYGVHVSCIKHSGKKRARQTAEIFSSYLEPESGVNESSGLKPLDDVTAVVESLTKIKDTMIVGHLPFMGRLTSYLITGSIDIPVFKFQNGGVLCIDKDPDIQSWVIKWGLMPDIS